MAVQDRLYTVDDLRELEKLPENRGKRFELIRGVIYDKNAECIYDPVKVATLYKVKTLLSNFSVEHNIVVEIIHENDSAIKVTQNIERYFEGGARHIWHLYPDEKVVRVHRLNANGDVVTSKLDLNNALDGEDVLPGFRLEVKIIFPD